MSKKGLSESDLCDKFIGPAIEAAGCAGMSQVLLESDIHLVEQALA